MAENRIQDMQTEGADSVDLADEPLPGHDVVDERQEYGDTNSELLEEMIHRVHNARDYWRLNHDNAREDVNFAYGEQWPCLLYTSPSPRDS